MNDNYTYDTFVVRPDGRLDMVVGLQQRKSHMQHEVRLRWGGENTWYKSTEVRLAKYVDLRDASLRNADKPPSSRYRKGSVIQGVHGKTRGTGAHVLTPCCSHGHYTKAPQEGVTCGKCGWMYVVAHFSVATFWMSLGFGRDVKRRGGRSRRHVADFV